MASNLRATYQAWVKELGISREDEIVGANLHNPNYMSDRMKKFTATYGPIFEQLAKDIQNSAAKEGERKKLIQQLLDRYREGEASVGRNAFFLTSNLAVAEKWAQQGGMPMVSIKIPKDELFSLAQSHKIYVGLEDQPEFGFHSPDAVGYLFENEREVNPSSATAP